MSVNPSSSLPPRGQNHAGASGQTFFVKSFGCQMNLYDAQKMADVVEHQGYRQAESLEAADLVILNTCHIRERASEKIYSELGKIRETKERRAALGVKTSIIVARPYPLP